MGINYHGGEPNPGTVYLVGSGPGDPGLLTVKAKRLLERADIVLHDKLPGPQIIEDLPEERRIDVGKRAHGDRTPQSEINERLVELAREGKSVVRLKGGDSFVFGRGGEEAEYLAEHGIPFEVVPAVTSAVAAPAVAGIPVTHRDHASSVSFVTGHEDPTKDDSAVDWDALADAGGTIVVLMGVTRLPQYVSALRDGGLDRETPAALVERGTWTGQRVATGTLETIVEARDEVGIEPPAVTVIGGVAATRESVVEFLENESVADREDRSESETDAVTPDVSDS
ncbi:uroporphyrinogen-III C-methyltransferase [Halobiforma nitratireducens]|uniref:uroporphyrinogen-III C-methyltransferase n=1 Tax=Halobiforma nitratireducens JCM 10879 TaxID=1227454 RepID=M0LXM3_9EURY|nr:uroporphyrinogen-III C-methyltransferase [Halobiforma nitratireducens]EMA38201.1 uroporphyrin-III C-methyltransferase [Halobiforma nitratireducens JCM 10879]